MNINFMTAMVVLLIGLFLVGADAHANVCLGAVKEDPDSARYETIDMGNWYHYEQGMRMVGIGDWGQALKEFNYYFRHPEMHRGAWGIAYYGIGFLNEKRGNVEAAFDCYKLAISRDWHSRISIADKAYQNMGAIHFKKKDYEKAIENYKKAVERDSNSGLAHYYLGLSYLKSGDLENAEKESLEAKKLGVTFTALDDEIVEAKNPAVAKHAEGDEQAKKSKSKKRKATK